MILSSDRTQNCRRGSRGHWPSEVAMESAHLHGRNGTRHVGLLDGLTAVRVLWTLGRNVFSAWGTLWCRLFVGKGWMALCEDRP